MIHHSLMEEDKKKLAIVGIFYDGYLDLWKDFFGLLKKNWPDCPYPLYVVDGELSLGKEDTCGLDVHFINAGKDAEYSRKVQKAVEKIDADYLLLLLEDFFVVKPVDNRKIENILQIIKDGSLDYYGMPMPEFIGVTEKERYKDKDLFRISPYREYVFSCQPSIWNKEFLKKCIGYGNYNAWIFEGIYATSSKIRRKDFLQFSVLDYNNPLNLRHGALQGKLVPETVSVIEESGYVMTTHRESLSIKQRLISEVKKLGHMVIRTFHLNFVKKMFKGVSVLEKYRNEIDLVRERIVTGEFVSSYLKQKGIMS